MAESPLDLAARLMALDQGRALPTVAMRRYEIHSEALLVVPLALRGERERLIGLAVGRVDAPSSVRPDLWLAHVGRVDSQREMWKKLDSCVERLLANNNHHFQLVVVSTVVLDQLDAAAERSEAKDTGVSKRVRWAEQRAAMPGSHSVVCLEEVLAEHWAFPLDRLDLPAMVRLLCEGVSDGPFCTPFLPVDLEEGLRSFQMRSLAGAGGQPLLPSEVEAAGKLAKKALQATFQLCKMALKLLAEDPRPLLPLVQDVCLADGLSYGEALGNDFTFLSRARDSMASGVLRYMELESWMGAWETAIVHKDSWAARQAALSGEALWGQVQLVTPGSLVVASLQSVLSLRRGDRVSVSVANFPGVLADGVVKDVQFGQSGYQLEISMAWPVAVREKLDTDPPAGRVVVSERYHDPSSHFECLRRYARRGPLHRPVAPGTPLPLRGGGLRVVKPPTPTEAEQVVLDAQSSKEPVTLVASPPGAGKTTLVVSAVADATARGEGVIVATFTRSQAIDVLRRLMERNVTASWLTKDLLPTEVLPVGAEIVSSAPSQIPAGEALVATVKRLHHANVQANLLVMDEAWQITDADFLPISGQGSRLLLIGDPGQIPPVVTFEPERWRSEPAGPHRPAPEVLLTRWGKGVLLVRLPATRRFPADSAALLAPFYPDHPFGSVASSQPYDFWPFDGRSLVMMEVPPAIVDPVDPALATQTVWLVQHAIANGVPPERIGVVCSYIRQVVAVQAALGGLAASVRVETANRWQGLQTDLVIGWHPLSGVGQVSALNLDAGRLCVTLSRHQRGMILLSRPGVGETLAKGVNGLGRLLADDLYRDEQWPLAHLDDWDPDPIRRSWLVHRRLLESVPRVEMAAS